MGGGGVKSTNIKALCGVSQEDTRKSKSQPVQFLLGIYRIILQSVDTSSFKYPRSSETRKFARTTIKGDIIKANKALRKTNMVTERAHLGDCTAGCLMDLIKTTRRNLTHKCSLFARVHSIDVRRTAGCGPNYFCAVISRRGEAK